MSENTAALRFPRPLWDMLGVRMPRGILGLSDPDVHRIGDEWVMFIGGFSTSFRNRIFCATAPADVSPEAARWVMSRHPLVADPSRRSWDAGGMHTPSYVPPHRGRAAMIFYAGRANRTHYGPGSAYAIGMLRQQGARTWVRHHRPVLEGWGDRASVLEPLVIPVESGYRMWFLATVNEVGPGEQPDFELHVSDSVDGESWGQPKLFSNNSEGFFDNAVYPVGDGWEMLLARGTNLHGTTPYPEQGLWASFADSPSADRADWSAPVRVLDTGATGTPEWMARGVCGPSCAVRSDGLRVVFFTGTHAASSWIAAARHRLRAAGRLPVPAPYFLATGQALLTRQG